MSSLFFAFADLVIHSVFNTDHSNPTVNKASSYLDLSPLYGSSDKEVDSIRRTSAALPLAPHTDDYSRRQGRDGPPL